MSCFRLRFRRRHRRALYCLIYHKCLIVFKRNLTPKNALSLLFTRFWLKETILRIQFIIHKSRYIQASMNLRFQFLLPTLTSLLHRKGDTRKPFTTRRSRGPLEFFCTNAMNKHRSRRFAMVQATNMTGCYKIMYLQIHIYLFYIPFYISEVLACFSIVLLY